MSEYSAVIWNEIEKLNYAVVAGDWSRFNGFYINSIDSDSALADELTDLVYDSARQCRLIFCELDVFADAIKAGAIPVECGFIP